MIIYRKPEQVDFTRFVSVLIMDSEGPLKTETFPETTENPVEIVIADLRKNGFEVVDFDNDTVVIR